MKNNLTDLNNHLFAQLERLSIESLSGGELEAEIQRSKAVTDVAKSLVSSASLQLSAAKLKAEYQGLSKDDLPKNLLSLSG